MRHFLLIKVPDLLRPVAYLLEAGSCFGKAPFDERIRQQLNEGQDSRVPLVYERLDILAGPLVSAFGAGLGVR